MKASSLTSFFPLIVHHHANNLLFAGHLRHGNSAGAFDVQQPRSAHDPPHNESVNYEIRISTGTGLASLDTRERKYTFGPSFYPVL